MITERLVLSEPGAVHTGAANGAHRNVTMKRPPRWDDALDGGCSTAALVARPRRRRPALTTTGPTGRPRPASKRGSRGSRPRTTRRRASRSRRPTRCCTGRSSSGTWRSAKRRPTTRSTRSRHFRQVAREAPTEPTGRARKSMSTRCSGSSRASTCRRPREPPSRSTAATRGTAPLGEPLDVTPGHHVVAAKMAAGSDQDDGRRRGGRTGRPRSFVADAPAPASLVTPAPAVPATAAAPAPAATDSPPPPAAVDGRVAQAILDDADHHGDRVRRRGGRRRGVRRAPSASRRRTTRAPSRGYQTRGRDSSLPRARPRRRIARPWNDAVNAQNRDANISNAIYFTAGALALGAVGEWFFWPKPVT